MKSPWSYGTNTINSRHTRWPIARPGWESQMSKSARAKFLPAVTWCKLRETPKLTVFVICRLWWKSVSNYAQTYFLILFYSIFYQTPCFASDSNMFMDSRKFSLCFVFFSQRSLWISLLVFVVLFRIMLSPHIAHILLNTPISMVNHGFWGAYYILLLEERKSSLCVGK